MYWEKDLETLSRKQLEQLQVERLNVTIQHARRAPYYKKLFSENGKIPSEIRDIRQIEALPFTTKQHLRDIPYFYRNFPIFRK